MEICYHTHVLPDYFTHVHEDCYEVMYCVRGGYDFHFNSLAAPENEFRNVRVKPKTLILVPMGVAHGTSLVQYPYERYFLQFDSATMERFLNDKTVKSAFFSMTEGESAKAVPDVCIWDVSNSAEKLEALFAQMYDLNFAIDMDDEWRELNMVSLFGIFWCELYRDHRNFFEHSLAQYTKPVQKIKKYIDHNYEQPITIETLASECFLSPNYLSKAFRRQVGLSPRHYLTQKRLEEARKLLCSTKLTIQEISARTGFGDVNYFIRQFKVNYGDTPQKYRIIENSK